ncbi:hypothetical protein [Sphingomicrobium sediminis]|uniref:Uncharacterized protein n=1 Tax=Sphingomicrobium sediminis TaxID=2950949 RepID=A0A9X2J2J7_9SPHN|nr:hypothetical protein [Sphingomicrobium sediminis]MCM8557095.1 hypothetical protein [Sphingomicrobium sediminis]
MIDLLLAAMIANPSVPSNPNEVVVVCWREQLSSILDQCASMPASQLATFVPPEEALELKAGYGAYFRMANEGAGEPKRYKVVLRTSVN